MTKQIITGFHAIEERLKKAGESHDTEGLSLFCAKRGPRINRILEIAQLAGIRIHDCDRATLDSLTRGLPDFARDHRGIVLAAESSSRASQPQDAPNKTDFEQWIASRIAAKDADSFARETVLIADCVTDPHNVGAILRSCDQFGVNLFVLPERRSANDFSDNEIISRASAGASAWVQTAIVKNLSRAVKQLKDAGFWIYAACVGGEPIHKIRFADKSAIIVGSEGAGISRLLKEQCDFSVSIPTCGKIDSLNVSVAAGILLYEISAQRARMI